VILKVLFWSSLGALAWTQLGYPLFAAALARVRSRPVLKGDFTPSVSLIVAAHDEEDVIERRLENLLALDYPPEQLEILVASDASTDRTDELVEAVAARDPRVLRRQRALAARRAAQARAQLRGR
jgi:cellulose synthase/poly-beta-1,6-N-acetylglucosamine synthase-like glycosyltransferase